MEWYMGRGGGGGGGGGGEMIVPQDQELSEQSVSQDNSFQWEEGLSMSGEIPVNKYMWNPEARLVGDWLDYQLDDMNGMDEMNDNFMTSFLEKDPQVRNTQQSAGTYMESDCSRMPFDNLLTDMGIDMDSQSMSQEQSCGGDLKYLEVPSPMNWDKFDHSPTYTPFDSKKSKCSLTRNVQVSETNTSLMADRQASENNSLEETALEELQGAMTQLTEETRISFRDALYRLAMSSNKQQLQKQNQCGEQTMEEIFLSNGHEDVSRFEEVEHMQFERNYFDSTVAHLMFNDLNNPPDLHNKSMQKTDCSNCVM